VSAALQAAEWDDLPPPPPSIHKVRIEPTAMYTPDETAWLLCLYGERGGKSAREIPEELLPVTRTGPRAGRVGYRGFDILAYLDGQRTINGKPAPPARTTLELVP